MHKGDYLSVILRSNKTVFSTKDIALLWQESNTTAARVRLHYFVEKGDLYRIRKGLYAKSKNYNKLELATRILTPSYVSFETVLVTDGLIFQFYESIFIASYAKREITIDGQAYSFRKMKDSILINTAGIVIDEETSIAERERAFLDMLYVNNNYHFDSLRSLSWEKVFDILPLYSNKRMERKVNSVYKIAKRQQL
jgi:predicted transcriptional regulator of viral defense system